MFAGIGTWRLTRLAASRSRARDQTVVAADERVLVIGLNALRGFFMIESRGLDDVDPERLPNTICETSKLVISKWSANRVLCLDVLEKRLVDVPVHAAA